MQRRRCTSCGFKIMKPGHYDPYVCRNCESTSLNEETKYAYLDR